MNLSSDYLVWVMNEHHVRKCFLYGLFICARRFIGYSPKVSSHPFITAYRGYVGRKSPEFVKSEFTGMNCVILEAEKGCFAIRMHVAEYINPENKGRFAKWFFADEPEKFTLDEHFIVNEIINEYWPRMLEYAKANRHFNYGEF